ncbi:hypothetical protein KBD08_00465 [Candidatus Babeliales bacterium]|nr:hypothetical protein [Candidatus Babeliales bacterium]
MKHKLYTTILLIAGYGSIDALNDYTNHTYMFVRPIFDSISIQQSSWHNIVYNKRKHGTAVQAIGIYGQSYPNLNNSAYFFFNQKNRLRVDSGATSTYLTTGPYQFQDVNNPTSGQIGVKSFNRDILGQWLGLTDADQLHIELSPQSRQACALLEISQELARVVSWQMFENWSIDIGIPFTWVENNLHVSGDLPVIQAFNQPDYTYVRMPTGNRSSISISQVSIALVTKYMSENDIQVNTSMGVIFPFSAQPCNAAIFEPIQGFNSHFCLDSTVHFQFPIVKKTPDAKDKILWFIDVHNNFLARNHQLRTYDIKDKPFSRYMKLLDRYTNKIVPAMNALTIRSRVEPFNVVDFMTGIRFNHLDYTCEIGYELWAHGSEVITPDPQINHPVGFWEDDRYGIAFINTDGVLAAIDGGGNVIPLPAGQLGQTASGSTINFVSAPDAVTSCCPTPTYTQKNRYLRLQDLNRTTCAAQPTITHRCFVGSGFENKGKRHNAFANFGAFIEAAQNNAGLCFWGGWIKGGCTF